LFAEIQKEINDGWKQRNHPIDPVSQRKRHLCPLCGKKGVRVKMEYLGNRHEQHQYTVYDVSYHICPRCGFKGKEQIRIEGRGTRGANSGRMYGSG